MKKIYKLYGCSLQVVAQTRIHTNTIHKHYELKRIHIFYKVHFEVNILMFDAFRTQLGKCKREREGNVGFWQAINKVTIINQQIGKQNL